MTIIILMLIATVLLIVSLVAALVYQMHFAPKKWMEHHAQGNENIGTRQLFTHASDLRRAELGLPTSKERATI